ncbi:hypothetical protein B484DRAFT_443388 [Ochromonadaceae sp. CCMP2298]|nr:hypothetical protein B484DRAFT_443388 [Ochromonadaceae sp. CCMP2298]
MLWECWAPLAALTRTSCCWCAWTCRDCTPARVWGGHQGGAPCRKAGCPYYTVPITRHLLPATCYLPVTVTYYPLPVTRYLYAPGGRALVHGHCTQYPLPQLPVTR